MENFDQIFYLEEETTTESTTKKDFNFKKPDGWDKKPKKKNKIVKFFSIMYKGMIGSDDMEPSEHRNFDIWMVDVKSILACILFTIIMFFVVISSAVSSTEYVEGTEKHNTLLDKAIDYVIQKSKYKQPKQQVVIVKDSLVNIDSVAYILKQSDSILNVLRHMDDSLTTKK